MRKTVKQILKEADAIPAIRGDEFESDELPGIPGDLDLKSDRYRETNIPAFSYKALEYFITNSYNERGQDQSLSLLIYGDPGIGKSELVRSVAERISKSHGGDIKFVTIDQANESLFDDIEKNPQNYFLFADIRASELDPTLFTGVPEMGGKKRWLSVKHEAWIYLLSLPGINGILFLDEFGGGNDAVQNAMLKVVLNHTIGPVALSQNVYTIAASNLPEQFDPGSGSASLIGPSLNRFKITALVANPQEWAEYARNKGLHPLVISFVLHEPAKNFYFRPSREEKGQYGAYPTPRSIMRYGLKFNKLSQTIKDPRRFWSEAFAQAKAYAGDAWASDFEVYVRDYLNIKWNEYTKTPTKIKKDSSNIVRGLTVKVARIIDNAQKASPEEKQKIYNEVAEVVMHASPEVHYTFMTEIKDHNKQAAGDFLNWLIHGAFAKPEVAIAWRGHAESGEGAKSTKIDKKSILGRIEDVGTRYNLNRK